MGINSDSSNSYEDLLDELGQSGTITPEEEHRGLIAHNQAQDPGNTAVTGNTQSGNGPGTVGPDDVPDVPGGTDDGGSSGAYSAGAGQAPTPFMRTVWAAEEVYMQLWGEWPPDGYIKALVRKGLNVFEIEEHERRKTAFKKTKTYGDEWAAFAQMVAQIMGRR